MDKPKSLRSRFEDNYTPVIVPAHNKRGTKVKYIYYAPWYVWDLPTIEFQKRKVCICMVSVFSFVLFCLSISIPCPVNSEKSVFLVSSLALCCYVMEGAALVQFLPSSNRTTKLKYEQISRGLDLFPALRAFFMAAALVLSLVFLLHKGFFAGNLIVTASYLGGTLLAWAERVCYKKIPFTTEKNDTLKRIEQAEREAKQSGTQSKS